MYLILLFAAALSIDGFFRVTEMEILPPLSVLIRGTNAPCFTGTAQIEFIWHYQVKSLCAPVRSLATASVHIEALGSLTELKVHIKENHNW